ncbi:MAG: glycosyltransferase family 39 protein [Bacteroidetes bacterium]|nr:glycosyltransferase family 39 protein [Bacteroidota bacterium]
MNFLKKYWKEQPLMFIVIIALVLRIISVVFSQGYGMHDDHFLVIEASQSWVDGSDYNNWLPSSQRMINPDVEPVPEGHSFFYVGLHFLIFKLLQALGIFSPIIKMYIIRFLHALFSLLVITYSYKITEKLSNQKAAKQVGLLLAMLWFMPFLSVHNLVGVVCIPFLLIGTWLIVNSDTKKNILFQYLLAGLIMGIGFSVRFQTSLFIGGVGLVLLFQKKWKEAIIFGIGSVLSIIAIQGIVDLFIWGRPFAELTEYIKYNIAHKTDYGTNRWYMYFLVLMGIIIPPVGIFLFFGWFRTWKKYTILFLPSFIFFLFHTLFPNKQERFILTIVPFVIIAGFIGWNEFADKSKFWNHHKKLLKACFVFFWTINFLVLPFVTTAYSKKSRVESMVYLSRYKDINSLICEDSNRSGVTMLPMFYLGQWIDVYNIPKYENSDTTKMPNFEKISGHIKSVNTPKYIKQFCKKKQPNFVLFFDDNNLEKRVAEIKKYYPKLTYETTIQPSFVDRVMRKLNPSNVNQIIYIYKINL